MIEEKNKSKERYLRDFKNDYKKVIEYHTNYRMFKIIAQMWYQGKSEMQEKGISEDEFEYKEEEVFKELARIRRLVWLDECKIIPSEASRYKKRHRKLINVTYVNAREGDDRSLWKLIKWDKAWLFIEWVRDKILEKEDQDNRTFFDRLSNAVKKNTRFNLQNKSRSKGRKKLIALIREVKNTFPIRINKDIKEFNKELHQYLIKSGDFEENDPLLDPAYYMRWLRRHGLKD